MAGWLGSYGGEKSLCDISRGMFSGEVGAPRLVRLFNRPGLRTTWFIPGHSIETFPDQCRMVVDAGHEIGMHGYSHENPIAMTPEQEEAVMDKCIALIERLCGRRPTGYVAPWWEPPTGHRPADRAASRISIASIHRRSAASTSFCSAPRRSSSSRNASVGPS